MEGTVDPDLYIVGPGDVLEIGIWGELGRRDGVAVNPDGTVIVNPVGPIKVDGLLLSQVRETIIEKLSKYYRRDIITVTLAGIRVFRVHVVGWVASPGEVTVNAVTRVSQALRAAGWVEPQGSVRNIVLIREGQRIKVDVMRYLLLGDNSANPFVCGGDVIYVPAKTGDVSILGEVNRPGNYEFVEGEALGDLIRLAGGFKLSAFRDTIEVQRFDSNNPNESFPIYVSGDWETIDGFGLAIGDRVFVRKIPKWHEDARVEIAGEVKYPGIYVIEEGVDTVLDLIERAGGLTEKASLAEARLVRGLYAESSFPVEREVDVYKGLQAELTDREKDLIGVIAREPKGALVFDFEKLFAEGRKADVKLRRGDLIHIPAATDVVRISGQVEKPGLVKYQKGLGYKDYIKLAGGFAPGADKRATRIIRAASGQKIKPGSQVVLPGDIIWVPTKPEKSRWDVAKDLIMVLGQVATIYFVIDALRGPD